MLEVKIKVEKFLMRQGIRVGKAALEFTGEGPLNGFHMVGFTICENEQKRYVMFPMSKTIPGNGVKKEQYSERNFFFLRPDRPELLDELQTSILDVYEGICENEFRNMPRMKQSDVPV